MKRLIWIGGLLGGADLADARAGRWACMGRPRPAPWRGGAAAPPPPSGAPEAQPPVACGTPQTVTGSITNSDPSHVNYINAAQACGGPPSCNLTI